MESSTFITETEWKRLSDSAFNPPDCSTPEASARFRSEYWAAHEVMRIEAERFVERAMVSGAKSERDDYFTMNEDFGHSRFIDIECHSPALISLHFARCLQSAICTLPERYVVALHHDLLDDRFGGLFDCFITADSVRVFCESIYAKTHFQDA